MKTAILAAVLLSCSVAYAQPSAPPPSFKTVASTDTKKGVIIFRETSYKTIPVLKEIIENVNGQQVKKVVTESVMIAEERLVEVNAAKSRIITANGKQLPIDEVWKRVKANSVIVFSGSYEAPAEAYLRTLSAEAVVIIPGAGAIEENRPPPPGPDKKKS